MKTRIQTAQVLAVVVVVGLGSAATGCGKYSYNNMRAMKAFKDANNSYQAQDWKKAVARYEDAIKANPDLNAGGVTIRPVKPDWATFPFPGEQQTA